MPRPADDEELKPAVLQTLQMLAAGICTISIDHRRECGYVEEYQDKPVRDPDHPDRKLLMPGVFRLFSLGLIDQFGIVTPKGRAAIYNAEQWD